MEITKNKIEAQNFYTIDDYTISISQFFSPLDKKIRRRRCVCKQKVVEIPTQGTNTQRSTVTLSFLTFPA